MPHSFVISPYSHEDQSVVEQRLKKTQKYVAEQLGKRVYVFSVIIHCHELAITYDLPVDYAFWKGYCEEMMQYAKNCHVLMLPGWETSKGVAGEIKIAKELGLDIIYVKPS